VFRAEHHLCIGKIDYKYICNNNTFIYACNLLTYYVTYVTLLLIKYDINIFEGIYIIILRYIGINKIK